MGRSIASAVPTSPSATRVAERLRERILEGEFGPGGRLPAERALAIEYGVSRTIVRMALDILEAEGCLERGVGCRPVAAGVPAIPDAGLVARRNIAVWITGEPDDVGAYSVLQGVQAALNPDQFRVLVASPRGRDLQELIRCEAAFLVRLAEDADVAGAILWYLGGEQNRELLEKARQGGKALVFLDRRPPVGMKADFVGIDNRRAARQLVARLITAGHTRIAHVTNNEIACTVADRRQGYEDALQESGLTYDPALVRVAPFQKSGEDQYHQFVGELMQLPQPPTAIFAVNDYMALCLRAAADASTVPAAKQLLVAGFDDLERWRPGPATLTTVRQPFERIGVASADLLLERLRHPQSDEYTSVIMDAPVIMRNAS